MDTYARWLKCNIIYKQTYTNCVMTFITTYFSVVSIIGLKTIKHFMEIKSEENEALRAAQTTNGNNCKERYEKSFGTRVQ